MQRFRFTRSALAALVLAAGAYVLAGATAVAAPTGVQAASGDWPRYLHDNTGSGFTTSTGITPFTAPRLKPAPGWPIHLGGPITTQPVVANGLIYVGAWDGYEYALDATGTIRWKVYLGRSRNCPFNASLGNTAGTVSTGAVATETVGGASRSVLYVGGGGNVDAGGHEVAGSAGLYALDALSGQVLWFKALGPSPSHLSWSSPLVYRDSVYMGVASHDDCPLIQGKLVKLDARTGSITHEFDTVPAGCEGGSVWGSPVMDEKQGSLYFASGNARKCSILGPQWGRFPHTKRGAACLLLALIGAIVAVLGWRLSAVRLLIWAGIAVSVFGVTAGVLYIVGPTISIARPYTVSLVKVRASDLSLQAYWHRPASEQTDYDFGSTPTLFQGTVTPGGRSRPLVGIVNKDGYYYVFDRVDLAAGPVARVSIAPTREMDPLRGVGSVSPSAYDGSHVYVAGGSTEIDGTRVKGSLSQLDPNNLAVPVWRSVVDGSVFSAVTAAPGIAVVGAGPETVVVETLDGRHLFHGMVASAATPSPAPIYGAATIAGDVVYQGDAYGFLYAYSLDGR